MWVIIPRLGQFCLLPLNEKTNIQVGNPDFIGRVSIMMMKSILPKLVFNYDKKLLF